MEWLIPICLAPVVASVYLGAWPHDVEGGRPLTQVLGVALSIGLAIALWKVLSLTLGGLGAIGWLVLPTVIMVVAFPALAWLVFRPFGVRIVKRRREEGH